MTRNRRIKAARIYVLFLLMGACSAMANESSVEWEVPAPRQNILSSYTPEQGSGTLNFYGYSSADNREIAQTFSLEVETDHVAIESVTLKLGRSISASSHFRDLQVDFYRIDSPTSRDLDPTAGQPSGRATVRLELERGEGKVGTYFKITFDKPVVLPAVSGLRTSYAMVMAFTDNAKDQQLILSYGKNIPGHRLMENTNGAGWRYVGGNPSLVYFLQGKSHIPTTDR